jgi:hypothetical protein
MRCFENVRNSDLAEFDKIHYYSTFLKVGVFAIQFEILFALEK